MATDDRIQACRNSCAQAHTRCIAGLHENPGERAKECADKLKQCLAACEKEPEPKGCRRDEDCPEGQVCQNGKCVTPVKKLYCCWVCPEGGGEAVKKQGTRPCSEVGKVSCDQPAPDCTPVKECSTPEDCIKKYGEAPAGSHWECKEGKCKKVIDLQECDDEHPCPEGFECIDGKCHPKKKGGLKCKDGKCVKVLGAETDEYCKGKSEGDECGGNGDGEKCVGGYKYSDEKVLNPDCKEDFEKEYFDGETWCCPVENGDHEIPEGEEFKWSERLERLLALLAGKVPGLLDYESADVLGKLSPILEKITGRMNYLFDYPRGTTERERQDIINYALKGVKRGERGEMQSMVDRLARRGMLGSGLEFEAGERIKKGTREALADIESEVAIDEINRRFEELMGTTAMAAQLAEIPIGLEKWDAERMFKEMITTTGMGADLIKTLMSSEVTPEQLSAGRRAESLAAMQMILNYLAQTEAGATAGDNVILEALLNQYFGGGEGGQGWSDWLPWLIHYLS